MFEIVAWDPMTGKPPAILTAKCREITEITDAERVIADRMARTMYAAPGIGLAAPQVGLDLRIIVVDVAQNGSSLLKLANPKIIKANGTVTDEHGEACLSIPGYRGKLRRAKRITVEALDITTGEKVVLADVEGLLCLCLQHEIDHLNGILYPFAEGVKKFRKLESDTVGKAV